MESLTLCKTDDHVGINYTGSSNIIQQMNQAGLDMCLGRSIEDNPTIQVGYQGRPEISDPCMQSASEYRQVLSVVALTDTLTW